MQWDSGGRNVAAVFNAAWTTFAFIVYRAGEAIARREGEEIVRAKRDKNCPHAEGGREGRLPPTSELTKGARLIRWAWKRRKTSGGRDVAACFFSQLTLRAQDKKATLRMAPHPHWASSGRGETFGYAGIWFQRNRQRLGRKEANNVHMQRAEASG